MQNILNIKYKLEESAKQEYAEARQALAAEEQKLDALKKRKQGDARNHRLSGKMTLIESMAGIQFYLYFPFPIFSFLSMNDFIKVLQQHLKGCLCSVCPIEFLTVSVDA